jgi:hypothetical protein
MIWKFTEQETVVPIKLVETVNLLTCIRISAGTPTTLAEVSRVPLTASRLMPEIRIKLSHSRFLPHSFPFIIHYHIIRRYWAYNFGLVRVSINELQIKNGWEYKGSWTEW